MRQSILPASSDSDGPPSWTHPGSQVALTRLSSADSSRSLTLPFNVVWPLAAEELCGPAESGYVKSGSSSFGSNIYRPRRLSRSLRPWIMTPVG